ncbi:MAG: hypothetical protein KJZ70_05360 [Bryobacterales bacterium]|nr:hypothetical protein [Bryobacterales bacterium]
MPCLLVPLVILAAVLTGCGRQEGGIESLGEAYAGAAHVPLYSELEANAKKVAELQFGDEVHLVRRRRNFYFVRGPEGKEGWTHRSNLFNERQVQEMKALAQWAAGSPSQGEARVFATLNVHNHPNRLAPTIFQITEEERVDVLAHERHPRRPYDPGPLLETFDSAPSPGTASEAAGETDEVPLPPDPPGPPSLPPSWLRLSGVAPERVAELADEGYVEGRSAPSAETSGELWTLVRNKQGLAGWALQGRLIAAIPDEVAQYSEGARITSYFALAPADADGKHQHWLWTTLKTPNAAFDFDSYRVFIWNSRRGRYETSFIARDVEGYLPVELFRHTDGSPQFRINIRERGGLIFRKTYELTGLRTSLVQSVPWPNYDPLRQPPIMDRLPAQPTRILPSLPIDSSFWEKTKSGVGNLVKQIFGG